MNQIPMKPAAMRAAQLIPTLAMLVAIEKRQGQLTSAILTKAAFDADCHPRTLRRQLVKYKVSSTVSSLVGKRGFPKGKPRLPAHVLEIITSCINKYYLAAPAITIAALMLRIGDALREAFGSDFPVPSRTSVKNLISKIQYRSLMLKREGKTSAERFSPRPGSHIVETAWGTWQIDETPVDVIPVTNDRKHPLRKLWLTTAIDIATRLIVGWAIDFRGPNSISLARCILSAALPKGPIVLGNGSLLKRPWYGLPLKIQLDSHSSHKHHGFKPFCEGRGIDLDFGIPGQPWVRGHIERVIGTMMGKVHSLPGTTFSNPRARGDYQSEAKAMLTISDISHWLELAIAEYNSTVHGEIGMPPLEAWKAEVQRGAFCPLLVTDEDKLRIELLPQRLVKIRSTGIHLQRLRYWHEDLRADILGNAPKTIVKYDPHDVRVLWLQRPNGNVITIFANGAVDGPPIDEWSLQAVKKAARDDGLALQDNMLLQATRRAMDELLSKASTQTAAARLQTKLLSNDDLRAGPLVKKVGVIETPKKVRDTLWNRASNAAKRGG